MTLSAAVARSPGEAGVRSRPAVSRGAMNSAASASPAPRTYAHRQPTVSATAGTATPAISVASGIADCLMPNDSPSRSAGTYRASVRFEESWPSTLHHALQSRIATRTGKESAHAATASMTAAEPNTPARLVGPEPKRSTSHPAGSAASALTLKKSATASPSPAGSKPSSAEICTASPPVRKTGSTVTVVADTAPDTARTAPGGVLPEAPEDCVSTLPVMISNATILRVGGSRWNPAGGRVGMRRPPAGSSTAAGPAHRTEPSNQREARSLRRSTATSGRGGRSRSSDRRALGGVETTHARPRRAR